MGIIFDKNVEEKELYSAYGLTVYGKENRYDSIFSPEVKSAYTTLRISNGEQNLADVYLGNRCVFLDTFDMTIDDFLYWIKEEKPVSYQIEEAVFKYLCINDSLFRHHIEQMKKREIKKKEDEKRIQKHKAKIEEQKKFIEEKCKLNNWIVYINDYYPYCDAYVFKPLHENAEELIKHTIELQDIDRLRFYIKFAEEHPDNTDLKVIANGDIDEVLTKMEEVK